MTSFGCIAFYVATLEMAVVSAKNEVEGKTTLLDECMLLMTETGPGSEKASRNKGKLN